MHNKILLVIISLLLASATWSQNNIPANTLTSKGAWCWFADPRAISHENKSETINNTYIGYIDVQGNIKATQINHLTHTTNEVLIRSWFQPDDHNNPTFLVLPDERVMIFYSRHTDEACFYYRISQKPGDITTLGKEVRLATKNNTTYPSPFILSDDPDHIYLCWRGIGWHPTMARLTMPDENDQVRFDWGPYQIVQSQKGKGGVRPYAKYMSNGKDKIYLAYTTTHPDNQSINYLYFNSINIHTFELKDIKGNRLGKVGSGVLHNVEAQPAYKQSYPDAVAEDAPHRNWLWEISVQDEQQPVIAMVRINDKKDSHDYYHVRWDGEEWKKTFLTNAGGHFHQTPTTEKCYSGGMAIDKRDAMIIYGSVPVDGKHGQVYELKKYSVTKEGTVASVEQLTFDSPKNNTRPYTLSAKKKDLQLAWMQGDYYDWIVSSVRPNGFPTSIQTNLELPQEKIDFTKGLLYQKSVKQQLAGEQENISFRKAKSFTISLQLSIDPDAYYGEIMNARSFVYGITQEEYPKPYLKVNTHEHKSTNVLGSADSWKSQNRGTGGHFYRPTPFETFHLAISYDNGTLRTYINGLIDQSVEAKGLSLSTLLLGGFDGAIENVKIHKRALSQTEIKSMSDHASCK